MRTITASRSVITVAIITMLWAVPRMVIGQATAERSGSADVRGARVIRIHAEAGYLHVNGRAGATTVDAHGTASASNARLLQDVKLIVERTGDVAEVRVDIPDDLGGWMQNESASLDLTVDVPANATLEVEDGSGDTEMHNVGPMRFTDGSGDIVIDGASGSLDIRDGSGDLTVKRVNGSVTVRDGSGGIYLSDITGSVEITGDGSGEVRIDHVTRDVAIDSKGSGGVDVTSVGGDFTVGTKGSGGVSYGDVKGKVSIPERHRHGGY